MRYPVSHRAFSGFWFILLPATLLMLLSAIFNGAAAVDAVPDPRISAAVDFLASYGWTAAPASCETAEVAVPETFGRVWEGYNDLQREQGFDLSPCRGRLLTRFTFTVTDPPPDAVGPVLANVFFDGETVVAADICAVGSSGFIRGVIG